MKQIQTPLYIKLEILVIEYLLLTYIKICTRGRFTHHEHCTLPLNIVVARVYYGDGGWAEEMAVTSD